MASNISIRTKLVLSFGVLVLTIFFVCLLSYFGLSKVARSAEIVRDEIYTRARLASELSQRAQKAEALIYAASSLRTSGDVGVAIAGLKEIASANGRAMESLDAMVRSEKGRNLLQAISKRRQVVRELYPTLFKNLQEGDEVVVRKFLKDEFGSALVGFNVAVADLAAHEEQAMGDALVSINETAGLYSRVIMIVGGVSLLGALITSIVLANVFTRRIQDARSLAAQVASGDLRSDGRQVKDGDELEQLVSGLIQMRASLAQLISQVAHGAQSMLSTAGELAGAARSVAESVETQSGATASAAAAVEQLTVSIEHVASNAQTAAEKATRAEAASTEGGRQVAEATVSIQAVSQDVKNVAGDITALSGEIRGISHIAAVIRDVAEQTNLLALNAAIEAARAGEQGRGFAVVADEVRKLAERTSLSVGEISTIIASIEQGSSAARRNMDKASGDVGGVATTAIEARCSMEDICAISNEVHAAMMEISNALGEQRSTATELSRSVEAIAQMSEENSASVGSVSEAAGRMKETAESLNESIATFRTV